MFSRSTTGGKRWDDIAISDIKGSPRMMAVHPRDSDIIYACGFNGYNTNREKNRVGFVYKSADAGSHWESVWETMDTNYLHSIIIDRRQPQNVYFGSEKGIYKSTDDGKSWKRINKDKTTALYITKTGALYAALADGILGSDDGGNTWSYVHKARLNSSGATTTSTALRIVVDEKNNILYTGSKDGLLKIALN
ncbi:WD40/YVTN/BNR-like repeat-containing protein [candidate division KSB1 bacterium]